MAKQGTVIRRIDGTIVDTIFEKPKKKPWTSNDVILVIMASLSVIFLAVFAYAPLYGLILAFKQDQQYINILHMIKFGSWAQSSGFQNFIDFFTDPDFYDVIYNTFLVRFVVCITLFWKP